MMGSSARPRIPIGYPSRQGINFRWPVRRFLIVGVPGRRQGTTTTTQMTNHENVCGGRIDYDYELPNGLTGKEVTMHESARQDVEDALAVLTEMQEDRTDEDGNVVEPITLPLLNSIKETVNFHLTPGCAILRAQQTAYEFNTGHSLDVETALEMAEEYAED